MIASAKSRLPIEEISGSIGDEMHAIQTSDNYHKPS